MFPATYIGFSSKNASPVSIVCPDGYGRNFAPGFSELITVTLVEHLHVEIQVNILAQDRIIFLVLLMMLKVKYSFLHDLPTD